MSGTHGVPSPRLDKNIRVLLTLDPAQYPLGIKGLITRRIPDVPVVWTNTNFKMLYLNMGHGDKVFASPIQNKLFENGIVWLLGK
jgi:type 1 glutamine amidotransferase